MTTFFKFCNTGYDPFIDFIKAYAIVCVLIGHTLPVIGYGFGVGMQVPLFILVQTFHYFKKENAVLNIKKLLQRVVLPFVVFGLIELLVLIFINKNGEYRLLIIDLLKNGGGYGPGSYFPLVYVQIAFLLPCFRGVFYMLNITQLFVFFFFIAEGLEITCSLIQPSGRLFRLLAIKYLFLVLFGWIWVKEGIILNRKMVILFLLSALTILYFEYVAVYFHMDNEP